MPHLTTVLLILPLLLSSRPSLSLIHSGSRTEFLDRGLLLTMVHPLFHPPGFDCSERLHFGPGPNYIVARVNPLDQAARLNLKQPPTTRT